MGSYFYNEASTREWPVVRGDCCPQPGCEPDILAKNKGPASPRDIRMQMRDVVRVCPCKSISISK